MATAIGKNDLFRLVRNGVDLRTVHAHTRKSLQLLLCGDPASIAEFRALVLAGHQEGIIPVEAAATLENLDRSTPIRLYKDQARAILFFGRRDDLAADLHLLCTAGLPIFAITVDESIQPSGPTSPPDRGAWAEYTIPAITHDAFKGRIFPHLVECCKGVEIALGRNLPALRETVAEKLTRDTANKALKIALASALVDHIPLFGIVLGALASAGDTVAITGLQMMLLLNIEATYGKDPDIRRMWQLLPIVGGGFGWRMLARELSGFIPVAGIAIKGAIAYSGTIVVGEGITFYYEHGRHMTSGQSSALYERTKSDALSFAQELIGRLKRR